MELVFFLVVGIVLCFGFRMTGVVDLWFTLFLGVCLAFVFEIPGFRFLLKGKYFCEQ